MTINQAIKASSRRVQPKYFEVVQKLKKEIDEKEGKKILKKQSAAQKKQRLDTNADAGVNVEPGGSEEATASRKRGNPGKPVLPPLLNR